MTMEGGGVIERGERERERERLLRNGSSDRDFNVEHTRFESIGPLRLAWEPVDMVQQLPLPPQTHPASLPLLLYPSVRDIISVSGNRAPSLQLFIYFSLLLSLTNKNRNGSNRFLESRYVANRRKYARCISN